MERVIQLTEFQTDALREICSVAVGNAATALSQMLNVRINMNVPKIMIVPVEKAADVFADPEALIYGVYLKLLGEVQGGILVTFPRDTGMNLVKVLLPDETVYPPTLTEMGRSALQEVGNIIAGSLVGAIAQMIKKSILISVPHMAFDMAGAIVDFILIECAQVSEQALVLEFEFFDVPKTMRGQFFIFPDPASMEVILKSVGAM